MHKFQYSSRKKLRGVERRLRNLTRWAESLRGWYFDLETLDLMNWLYVPVMGELVEGPKTTIEIQRRAAESMIQAAINVSEAKPASLSDRITCCLIYYPYMAGSEVLDFESVEVLRRYLSLNEPHIQRIPVSQATLPLSARLGFAVPSGYREIGFIWRSEIDNYPEPNAGEFYECEGWLYVPSPANNSLKADGSDGPKH